MVEVRAYTEDDYDAVAANLKAADMFIDSWQTRENLNGLAASPDSHSFILVAEDSGEVVGNILTTSYGPNVAFFWGLTVIKERRRQGIARMLLAATQEKLAGMGVTELCALVNTRKSELLDYYADQNFRYGEHDWKVIWRPTSE